MTTYEPKFGRVLIQREVQKKNSLIIVPNAKNHAKCEGVIVGLGETAGWIELNGESIQTLKVGNKVIFGRHSGAWIDATYTDKGEQDDGTLFICQDADILCVVKPEQKEKAA